MNESEKREVEEDFWKFMRDSIWYCARNVTRSARNGYRNVIEEFAYTWFNRFIALKFMEIHGFLPHGFRVLSDPAGGIEPEIMKNLNLVEDDLHFDMSLCSEYKQQEK